MEFTMYDTLLQLPLFQGLSKNDITDILSKVKFHFKKYETGEYIFRQGDICTEVGFLLSGTLIAETVSNNHSYMFCEALSTACVIELYSLFGIRPSFQASYRAVSEVSVLTRPGDTDHERGAGGLLAKKRGGGTVQAACCRHVQVQQPGERKVDLPDLIEVQLVTDAAQPEDVLLVERGAYLV